MKRLLLALTTLVTSVVANAEPDTCEVFDLMDDSQFYVIEKSYMYGKSYGYEWLLPAQAWKESSAGKKLYLKDIRGGSHGIYQNLLDNVLYREFGMRLKPKRGEKLATKWYVDWTINELMTNQEFAAKHAILELQFWKPRTKSTWAMLASYNGGYYGPKITDAKTYANKILRYGELLKGCKNSPLYGYE